jgi:hypothetical protein
MKLLVLPLALLTTTAAQLPPAPRLTAIEMASNSWGKPVASWRIDAAGNGRYTVPEPNTFNAKRLVTRSFAAGTTGFRKLRVLLGSAEVRREGGMPCIQRITDQVYGQLVWTPRTGRAHRVAFDYGCRDLGTRRILTQISAANDLVAGWAAQGPIVETKPVE